MRSIDELIDALRAEVRIQLETATVAYVPPQTGVSLTVRASVVAKTTGKHFDFSAFGLDVFFAEPTISSMMNVMSKTFGDASGDPLRLRQYRRSALRLVLAKQGTSGWYDL